MDLVPDQINERRELLGKCLGMAIIQAQSYANRLTDSEFLEAINGTCDTMLGMNMRRPELFPDFYFGRYYTIDNYRLLPGCRWEALEKDILQCLTVERQAREVIEFFLHQPDYQADFADVKARFTRCRKSLDSLMGFRLLCKLPARAKHNTAYALRGEVAPLIRRVLESPKSHEESVQAKDSCYR